MMKRLFLKQIKRVSRIGALTLLTVAAFADDLPPGIVNTQNPADVSLTPQESLSRITVPAGFHVTLFAGEPDVRRPIAFDFDDRGRLWVVENYSHPTASEEKNPDRILIFTDTDNDGQFDERKVFWSGGRYLTAIAYGHGGVWVGNTPELSFIPDRNGDDVPDSEPVVILDGFAESSNNVLNNFHWGPDGWLYGAIGLNQMSYVGKPGTPKSDRVAIPRGIWRMHPVTHNFEIHAVGMVNPWGADFNEYGDLITTNTVISHLWHIVPGMYLQRRGTEQDYAYAYGRIQAINDHLHWGGGQWTDSRQSPDGVSAHRDSVAGGGHAHCGGMVYLGNNWPERYRGQFFTCNLHGNRVNVDNLVPNKSTYVGTHSDDFLMANDPWFRGLTIKYGPDGGVYISDWHDFGECHDTDGSHRTSGRIYKITYGEPPISNGNTSEWMIPDLNNERGEFLVGRAYQGEWFARHIRRILHERAVSKSHDLAQDSPGRREIGIWLAQDLASGQTERALNALWTKHLIDDLTDDELVTLCDSPDEHLRRWAIRLLVDRGEASKSVLRVMERMAAADPSAKVRLALASALQRIDHAARWPIAEGLLSRAEDVSDPYIPLMIWYGIEPMITANQDRSLRLAADSQIPLVRQYIARRLLDGDNSRIDAIIASALGAVNELTRLDYLNGMREALDGSDTINPPATWRSLYSEVTNGSNADLKSTAIELARIFGDQQAIANLQKTLMDSASEIGDRRSALHALLKLDKAISVPMLHDLINEPNELRNDALYAMAITNNEDTPSALLRLFPKLTANQKQSATSVLTTRSSFVPHLLDAINAGTVLRRDVSAYSLQHLRSYKSDSIQSAVAAIWHSNEIDVSNGTDTVNAAVMAHAKAAEIAHYKDLLTPDYLATGDASSGRQVFVDNCAKCHTLFGMGGEVGPDLTGSGRASLDYVLSNLVDPSALVDEAFRLTTIEMNDGRLFNGFIQWHGESDIVVRTQDATVKLVLSEIDDIQTTSRSMMPDGLLQSFSDSQVRDLVVYLASPEQVALPLVE